MKKLVLYISLAAVALFSSCNDYLDVRNESKVDNEFVFSSAYEANQVIIGAYELFRANSGVHSNGLFYDMMAVASDFELGPEMVTSNQRYNNENFYPNAVNINGGPSSSWNAIYKTINRCNIILNAFENNQAYLDAVAEGKPSDMTHMYGEVATMRAIMYYELTKVWGDVIYSTAPIMNEADYTDLELTDRCLVQEGEIAKLREVEPLMYYINQNSRDAERLTRDAAQAMIGRLALVRGGYALRKPDADKSQYEILESDAEWGFTGRRTDWKEWYQVANEYLKKLEANTGAIIITDGKGTGNPFQQIFQQQMNLQISQESIYEVAETPGIQNERPYAFGRPSSGAKTAYPPKAYGQIRFLPWFYWGEFDPQDLRRDVTVAVTGLSGAGQEVLIPWIKGNVCAGGGIALNKWDYCRMTNLTLTVKEQRKTGVNATYIRLADMLLLLAETEAVLAKEGVAGYSAANAKVQLQKIRSRAYSAEDQAAKVDNYLAGINSPEEVFEAVQTERMFELAGEGQRKYDLVRWGLLAEKVVAVQQEMDRTLNDLKTKGYVEYANGQQFPSHVYVKQYPLAEAEAMGLKNILIDQTPADLDPTSELYAMQAPGWRGNTDLWESPQPLNYQTMAIRGLFKYIPEGSAEHTELIAAGYSRVTYGMQMVVSVDKNGQEVPQEANWNASRSGTLGGYLYNVEYPAKKPVRYLQPIPSETITYSNYKITNSYGFPNE